MGGAAGAGVCRGAAVPPEYVIRVEEGNACDPTCVFRESVTPVNLPQLANAYCPIYVTPDGIEIFVRLPQK